MTLNLCTLRTPGARDIKRERDRRISPSPPLVFAKMSVRPYVFLSTPFWERDGGGGNGTKLNSVSRTLLQASLGQGMVTTIASGEALKSADDPKKHQGSVTKAAQSIINHLLQGEPMAPPFSSSNVQDLLQALYVGGDITLFKVDDIADAPDATTAAPPDPTMR